MDDKNPKQPDEDPDHEPADGDEGTIAPVPFAPDKEDDSPLGDTDQHSDA